MSLKYDNKTGLSIRIFTLFGGGELRTMGGKLRTSGSNYGGLLRTIEVYFASFTEAVTCRMHLPEEAEMIC